MCCIYYIAWIDELAYYIDNLLSAALSQLSISYFTATAIFLNHDWDGIA